MKNKRWRFALMSMLVASSVMVFGACSVGKELAEEVILEAVKSELLDVLSSDETIDVIELLSRETDKENKLDELLYKVITNDGEIEYEKYYSAKFDLVDKEWVMDDVEEASLNEWTQKPLTGVDESKALAAVIGQNIEIDGEAWQITRDNVSLVSVVSHNTDLDAKHDEVTIEIVVEDIVEQAKGEITVEFYFGAEWSRGMISNIGTFEAEMRPNVGIEITDEKLIADLIGQEIPYGKKSTVLDILDGSNSQKIKASSVDEISEFVITKRTSQNKGCEQIVECRFLLDKVIAEIDIQATISYVFSEEGWTKKITKTQTTLKSLDIEGDWKGSFSGIATGGIAVLTITEVYDDYSMEGIYEYTPIEAYNQPGSYKVSGRFEPSTFEFLLAAGEWVKENPKAGRYEKSGISGALNIEKQEIEGVGHDNCVYEVKLY